MITIRTSDDRGRADHGWLDTRHTFSFAGYDDPRFRGYRTLRVLNEDRVAPGQGFGTHGHRDMEILSIVLEGALQHRDSLGTSSIIRPGDVQRMTAGTGVRHSEFNPSPSEPVHFLQIWIHPEATGLKPGYEQKAFPTADRRGKVRLVASRDGRESSVTIHQDASVYATTLAKGESVALDLGRGRGAWVQAARGEATVNGKALKAGDGASVEGEPRLDLRGVDDADLIVFDLA